MRQSVRYRCVPHGEAYLAGCKDPFRAGRATARSPCANLRLVILAAIAMSGPVALAQPAPPTLGSTLAQAVPLPFQSNPVPQGSPIQRILPPAPPSVSPGGIT